ncbi:protein SYS1 homolog isoform X2 [Schistocerca gregaria]|uniref:protein SYS1 homolog isoform X2 n=1 Tax=Schistocerca gregaria TaxID=7010 RepID=UPI00211E8416|nr:protein SYS1 homolog isoform X2 [Schistocerca gregaria]
MHSYTLPSFLPSKELPKSQRCGITYFVKRKDEVHVRDVNGKLIITAFVLNALVGALGLWFIVQRTKQCLDFSCTAHLIHLIICWYYNSHFPSAFSWWLLNIVCLTIMCVCGEFLCMRTELQAIPLNMGPKADL